MEQLKNRKNTISNYVRVFSTLWIGSCFLLFCSDSPAENCWDDPQKYCQGDNTAYNECTCSTQDPCNWSNDGVCDEACVTVLQLVDTMFEDDLDCIDPDEGVGALCGHNYPDPSLSFEEGSVIRNYTFYDKDGNHQRMCEFHEQGRYLLLSLSATSCPVCEAMIPYLQELQDYYQDQGLLVAEVLIDVEDPAFLSAGDWQFHDGYPVFLNWPFKTIARDYGIEYTPSMPLIDLSSMKIVETNCYGTTGDFARCVQSYL